MKKMISLLLALFCLMAVLACCTKPGDSDDGTNGGTAGTQADDGRYHANVPDKTFDGQTFIIMGRARDASWGEMGLFSDGADGTVLNDAVYDRNMKVVDDYGIDLQFTEVSDSATSNGVFYNMLVTNAMTGDHIADICAAGLIDACSLIAQNMFVDLETLPYVDLTAPWWQQKLNESVKLLNRQYFGFNDMMLNDKCDTYLIYFNKTNFDDNDLEYPYQMVKDGTWTNDKMLEYVRNYGADLNGNGFCDPEDKIGYAYLLNDTFYVGAGITGAALDGEGYPYLVEHTEKHADIFDDIKTLVTGSTFNAHAFGDLDTARAIFDDDGLFLNFHMLHMMDIAANYESNVGIVPCPKYDENQTEYYSRAGYNGATCITVLSSTPDLERAGILLEVFSAESKNYISPAFYEKLFTDRYTNDDESKEMLSIVIESEIIDLDQVFKWGELLVATSSAAARGTGNSATLYGRLSQMAQSKLDQTIDSYFTIGQ